MFLPKVHFSQLTSVSAGISSRWVASQILGWEGLLTCPHWLPAYPGYTSNTQGNTRNAISTNLEVISSVSPLSLE